MQKLSKSLKIFLALLMLGLPLVSQLVTSADEIDEVTDYGSIDESYDDLDDDWDPEWDFDLDLEPIYPDFELEDLEAEDAKQILPSTGIIVGTDASVYDEAGGGQVLATLPPNTNIQFLESDDDWYRIKFDGQEGWVLQSNVEITVQIAIVLNEDTPFKESDHHDADVLFELASGTPLSVEVLAGDWVRTTINDETGWVNIDDLSIFEGQRPGVVIYETTFHEEPNESSAVIKELPLEYQVMIIQRTRHTETDVSWSQVRTVNEEGEALIGWIQTDKLIFEHQIRYVNSVEEHVPLLIFTRDGYRVEREVPANSKVTVMAEVNLWSFVMYAEDADRFYGWIANEFLNVSPVAEEVEDGEEQPVAVSRTNQITTLRHTGVTVVDDVSLREGPGTEYRRLGRIPANTNVRITGRLGSWNRIVHNGETFWVRRSALRRTVQRAIVNGNNVPVRASASTNANILTRATHGTRVSITQRTGSWARVTVNNQTGWIRTNQLRITNGRVPGQTTVATNLHVRPNANSPRSRRLTREQEVMLVQRTTNGTSATAGWTQVVVIDAADRSYTGWVRTDHVERGNYRRRIGGASQISVRQGPGSSYDRIPREGRIPRNTSVRVLAEAGSWSRIRFDRNGRRHYGWVRSRNVMPIHTMHHEVEGRLRSLQGGRSGIGISYFCLITERHISINGNRVFFAASTIKLSAHMMLAEDINRGRLSWDQIFTIRESDMASAHNSGVLFGQGVRPGHQFTLYDLMRYSIVHSDNIGFTTIMRAILPNSNHFGMEFTNAVYRRFFPGQTAPGRHRISPNQQTIILRELYEGLGVVDGYDIILNYMMNTAWNDRFITPQTNGHVAHVPGWTPPYQNDSGIFFTDHPYILVVYTEGVGGVPFLSQVANEVFRINRRFDN